MTKIDLICILCRGSFDTTVEWIKQNQLVMCPHCCKSFDASIYLEDDSSDDDGFIF